MIAAVSICFLLLMMAGGVFVSWTNNVVHAVYGLALILVVQAGVFVVLGAELLAVTQLLLYAGGAAVIIVFGVMMTTRKAGGVPQTESRNVTVSALISFLVFGGLCTLIRSVPLPEMSTPQSGQIAEIGVSFFTDHLIAFELIAFILLVALVGATYVAKMSSEDES